MKIPSQESLMVTEDELRLIDSLRTWVGGPYLTALTEEQRAAFSGFLKSLRGNGEFSSMVH